MRISLDRGRDRMLVMLLAGDLLLFVLHILHMSTPFFADNRYDVEVERGFGEVYQYVKFGWTALLLAMTAARRRRALYAAWSMVFCVLLLDDAFMIHEKLGRALRDGLELRAVLGLRGQDLGELLYAAAAGALLALVVGAASLRAGEPERAHSMTLVKLAAVVLVFGVGVDMLHQLVPAGWPYAIVGFIEDGGEMVAMTAVVAFAFRLGGSPESD